LGEELLYAGLVQDFALFLGFESLGAHNLVGAESFAEEGFVFEFFVVEVPDFYEVRAGGGELKLENAGNGLALDSQVHRRLR
jgi:hypothetical protein